MSDKKIKNRIVRWLPQDQMSEAFINSAFLAISGGWQDAYTYFARGKVFSNAQTGNVVLMSFNFMNGDFVAGVKYLLPFLAFGLGVFIAENINYRYKTMSKIHWRQLVLIIEMILLTFVGFLPHSLDFVATITVSLSCAMQVQTFRKVSGYAYASTMCIGNLRSGVSVLSAYIRDRKPVQLRQTLNYFGVIFAFAIGAGLGGYFAQKYGIHVIWLSVVYLMISFAIMSFEKLKNDEK